MRRGIMQIDVPIGVNIGHEHFALRVQRLQQSQGLAVSSVHSHPLEAHANGARMTHNLFGQLRLGLMHLLCSRNASLLATRRIVSPFLRQIQTRVNQAYPVSTAERAKHADLAVVLLTQAPVPLPGNAHRLITLFLECALVDVQTRAHLRTNPSISVARRSIHDAAMFPRGVGEKVLQHLVVAVGYRFDHALHVALFRLHQAKQVLLRRLRNRMITGSKLLRIWARKSLIVAAQLAQRFVIANPIFECASSVIFSRSYLSRKTSVVAATIILDIPVFSNG
jgi:hypothetical protein